MTDVTRAAEITEWPFLRAPFEALKRSAKDRKSLVDEISESIEDISKVQQEKPSREQQVEHLSRLLSKLQGVKRKLQDVSRNEKEDALRCKLRLEHVSEALPQSSGSVISWTKSRMDRILVDYCLRSGYFATADKLVAGMTSPHLVDSEIFLEARKVIDSLKQHECSAALDWCAENAAKLKKSRSKLEFKLRLQEFIVLVMNEKRIEAIEYARKHLAQWAGMYMLDLQRALAALAFPVTTKCSRYQELFEEDQWQKLINLFLNDLYRCHSLSPESMLAVHLQAGLCALKTPRSYQPGCNKEDPLHLATFQTLAKDLPFAKPSRSKLICAITHEVMNDANPPMVLPNGYVYSQKAVQLVMSQNQGKFVCPKTGASCSADELRRAFVA